MRDDNDDDGVEDGVKWTVSIHLKLIIYIYDPNTRGLRTTNYTGSCAA